MANDVAIISASVSVAVAVCVVLLGIVLFMIARRHRKTSQPPSEESGEDIGALYSSKIFKCESKHVLSTIHSVDSCCSESREFPSNDTKEEKDKMAEKLQLSLENIQSPSPNSENVMMLASSTIHVEEDKALTPSIIETEVSSPFTDSETQSAVIDPLIQKLPEVVQEKETQKQTRASESPPPQDNAAAAGTKPVSMTKTKSASKSNEQANSNNAMDVEILHKKALAPSNHCSKGTKRQSQYHLKTTTPIPSFKPISN